MNIPTILFINKIDQNGVDIESILEEIQNTLTNKTIPLQNIENEGTDDFKINNFWFEKQNTSNNYNEAIEKIAETDDNLLNSYLENFDLDYNIAKKQLQKLSKKAEIFPIIFGSAKSEKGINALEEAIIELLPSPTGKIDNEVSAIIYKVEHDKLLGKISHIRIFNGSIKSKDLILNSRTNKEEKVAQLKKKVTNKLEDITILKAGDVGIITGFNQAKAGDILGTKPNRKFIPINDASILTVKVKTIKDAEMSALHKAFIQIADEDPSISPVWYPEQRELLMKIQGKMQIEILTEIIKERFQLDVIFDKPTIIYKETPLKKAEGYVRYWMPKPCWAIMKFIIEPGEKGSGISYKSLVSTDKIKQRYQNQIKEALPQALKQGIKGWEVTDIKITLIDGEDHEVHTHSHDFTVATPMGIMDGLVNTETNYLEPILSFKITAPEEMLGTIAGDLTKMRASFGNPEFINGKFILKGEVPAAESIELPVLLASKTAGKAKVNLNFLEYQICDNSHGVKVDYRGISPLDTQKYILHIRNAL